MAKLQPTAQIQSTVSYCNMAQVTGAWTSSRKFSGTALGGGTAAVRGWTTAEPSEPLALWCIATTQDQVKEERLYH